MREPQLVSFMALVRIVGAVIEIAGALLMLALGGVRTALTINAVLGVLGPLVLLGVAALGVVPLAGQLPWSKVLLLLAGTLVFLLGLWR